MSARLLERPCPNCGARDSLEVDNSRGEIACSECAVVVVMGMEESESTRFTKDATMADADEDTRGGVDGSHMAGRGSSATAGLNPRMVALLRVLREHSGVPESVVSEAAEMCRQFAVKQKERNARVEKPLPLTAACFHVASVFVHYPILTHELIAYDRTLSSQDIVARRTALLSDLRLGERYAQVCQQERYVSDLLILYFQRLKWNIQALHDLVLLVHRVVVTLRVDRMTRDDEIVASIVLLRLESRVQQALSKSLSRPTLTAEVQWVQPGTSGAGSSGLVIHATQQGKVAESLFNALAAVTKFSVPELKNSYEWLLPHMSTIVTKLAAIAAPTAVASPAEPATQPVNPGSNKRPREE